MLLLPIGMGTEKISALSKLTVGDLVRIIEIGKMDDEIINKLINITK